MREVLCGALILLIAGALSCHRGPRPLARVGDRVVTSADLAAAVAEQTGKTMATVNPALAAAVFESYLEEEVVLAAGKDTTSGETLSPSERNARVRDLLARLCPPPPQPEPAEIEAYLAQHSELGKRGERLLLRQLILPDRATARLARQRLARNEDFGTVSRELSRAPNAAQGGMLGWVERGQLPPEFEAAVIALGPGEISEPVASNAGWHVFQVVERRPAGGGVDSEARSQARAALASRDAEAQRNACLRTLAARVGVQVECAGVAFPCRNPFEETK